ncbi:MAG: 16S rRNA (adenine(1518)-N(6)/adenine(1519)-N(6))-dimethyltransferase RsmA [Sulfuricurvum sp.]|jgi:16S rRNA (adenine1518-N6/adenine1519-N6)-dimethyltransferase
MQNRTTKAKKRFGQNFLRDESVVSQIIQSMPLTPYRIAEIGPGLGDLTKYLVDVKSVTAFEVDTDLCKHLQHHFADAIATNKLTLRCGDVLETWKSELLDEPYDLVANLPYYIATNIILKALADPACKNMLVMIQREVAEKFSAAPNERAFGALSVITQSVADVEIVLHVPPTAFEPAPKVDSAVLLIRKTANRNDEEFEEMLRSAFTQPRKTLYKNLTARYDGTVLTQAFTTLELERTIRPHQLSTSDFHRLYALLQ